MAGFSYSQHNISFDYEKLPGEVRALHDALPFKKVKYSDYSINVAMAITGYLQKTGFPIFHSYRPLPIKNQK